MGEAAKYAPPLVNLALTLGAFGKARSLPYISRLYLPPISPYLVLTPPPANRCRTWRPSWRPRRRPCGWPPTASSATSRRPPGSRAISPPYLPHTSPISPHRPPGSRAGARPPPPTGLNPHWVRYSGGMVLGAARAPLGRGGAGGVSERALASTLGGKGLSAVESGMGKLMASTMCGGAVYIAASQS